MNLVILTSDEILHLNIPKIGRRRATDQAHGKQQNRFKRDCHETKEINIENYIKETEMI